MIDDTIARKVNSSDASHFAEICGCFPSRVGDCISVVEADWLMMSAAESDRCGV